MTAAGLATGVLLLLVLGAVAGPRVLDASAPAFSRRPRLGMAAWSLSAGLWTVALLAFGPLLAWVLTGPALPGTVGTTCRRCLAAANPFPQVPWSTDVPVVVLLAAPAVLTVLLVGRTALRSSRGRSEVRGHLRGVTTHAGRRTVAGAQAWILPTPERLAYSLPGRRAGVVVSQGTLDALDADQLTAVVVHEQAHLSHRHHALLGLLGDLRSVLGRIPLIARAGPAVAAYAEMAADDAARRRSSTRALAGALLLLATAGGTASPAALHAAAVEPSWRARRLVQPAPPTSPWGIWLIGGYLVAVLAAVTVVGVPYASVLVAAGC